MTLWLFAVGLISILGQVVLLRELLVISFGSELVAILALGVWLAGTALGAMPWRRSAAPSEGGVRALFLLAGALLPLLLVLVRCLRLIFAGTPGAYLPFVQQVAGVGVVLLPFSALMGLVFRLAATPYASRSTLAFAYALESAGGLAGGVAATLLLAWGVQNFSAGLVCALACVLAASLPWSRARRAWLAPCAALGFVLLTALHFSAPLDISLTALSHPDVLESRDTPYGRVTVTGARGQVSVFGNDALAFESQGTSAEEFVHLAALRAARPGAVLVIGGGPEGMVMEALKHRPARVDDVELDREALRLVAPHMPGDVRESMNAPAVTLVLGEPRRFLERAPAYDLILVGMPEPDSGQAARFYTREFFEACARHLSPGGVLALRLRSAENLWTPALARRNGSIYRALAAVFGDVLVLPGGTSVLIASRAPLVRDPDVLAGRWQERGITARLVSPAYVRYLLTNDRGATITRMLRASRAPMNTDARPVCYSYTLLLWLSRFFPAAARLDANPTAVGLAGACLLAPVLLLLLFAWRLRRSAPWRGMLVAACAGFIGMTIEGALLLGYQIRRGVLYEDLGFLLTVFMAGLAAGAWGVARWDRGRGERGGLSRLAGAGLAAAGVLLAGATAMGLGSDAWTTLPGTGLLLFVSGLLVGALFAYASLRRAEDQASAVGPLYAADLVGGCAGSLAGSLLLLPLVGLPGSALYAGLVACALLALV